MEINGRCKGRTVVVSGVPDVLPASRMADKLTVHFQSRRRSHGGDVEVVEYPTNMDGVAFVTFDVAEDAEKVVQKEQQIMADSEFPENYLLTVFPFTTDVFLYVAKATVNLSVFGSDQAALIQSLQSAHRSLRFQPLLQQRKARIEGPFRAIQALRDDLICRASWPKSMVPAQDAAAANLRGTPLDPRLISHQEFVSSASCGSSKAKVEVVSSNSLSAPLQTTGEATRVQTLLSDAKSHKASSRRKVSSGSLAEGRFCNTNGDEEKQRARSRVQMPSECGTRRAKAEPRQVVGQEINAGIISSLSGPAPCRGNISKTATRR